MCYKRAKLEIGNIHCHHKIRRINGGSDNYGNLMLVTEIIHKLLHAENETTIRKLLKEVKLTQQQIEKLNTYRRRNNLKKI